MGKGSVEKLKGEENRGGMRERREGDMREGRER